MDGINGNLSMDFMLSDEETENLFVDNETQDTQPDEKELPPIDDGTDTKSTEVLEEIDTETLFEPLPESVGSKTDSSSKSTRKSKETKLDMENTTSTEDVDNSPNTNFYSSTANAFKVDGIFQNLSDEEIEQITDADSFSEAAEREVRLRLEDAERRIYDALNAKIEPSVIGQYENTLKYLNNITEANLSDEGDAAIKLRQNLIFQDFLNRGFSRDRAEREVKRAFDNGTDIDDATEALASNKQFFNDKYNKLVKDAQDEEQRDRDEKRRQSETLKNSILNESKVFGDLDIDKQTRQKVYETITRPIYKDKETGEYMTALQKYENDNHLDFLKNVGLLYTLTDGFKNIDSLIKGKVKKGVSKGIRDLEKVLKSPSRSTSNGGSYSYMSGSNTSKDTFWNGRMKLDI